MSSIYNFISIIYVIIYTFNYTILNKNTYEINKNNVFSIVKFKLHDISKPTDINTTNTINFHGSI